MRNLFFLLVLANVLFYGWQNYIREPVPEGVTVVDPDSLGEQLTVRTPESPAPEVTDTEPAAVDTVPDGAAESEPLRDASAVAETAALEAGDDSNAELPGEVLVEPALVSACLSIGPFTESSEAQTELSALRAEGYEASRRSEQGQVFVGYWTFVDKLPTRGAARATLAKLKGGGIEEAYLIANGPGEDAISLGIFSGRENAERARDQAAELDIEARITNRYRDAEVYWVDTKVSGAGAVAGLVEEYGEEKVLLGSAGRCP